MVPWGLVLAHKAGLVDAGRRGRRGRAWHYLLRAGTLGLYRCGKRGKSKQEGVSEHYQTEHWQTFSINRYEWDKHVISCVHSRTDLSADRYTVENSQYKSPEGGLAQFLAMCLEKKQKRENFSIVFSDQPLEIIRDHESSKDSSSAAFLFVSMMSLRMRVISMRVRFKDGSPPRIFFYLFCECFKILTA